MHKAEEHRGQEHELDIFCQSLSKIGSVSLKPEYTGFCQKEKGTQLNKPMF